MKNPGETHDEFIKRVCFCNSKQCKSVKEFRIEYPTEYRIAKQNNWLKEMLWLHYKINN